MAQSAPARTKINTKVTQPAPGRPSQRPAGRPWPGRPPKGPRVSGDARDSVRQSARPVIELDFGILVYPPETHGEPWRAVFTENGQRRYRQGATEAKLAEKLEKVRERLQADAANMERPGADLIKHYLDPDRLPARDRWSRKHAHTQRRLCERFAEPVIGTVTCQDIKTGHMQQIVNAAPTAGEGDRVHGMLSALVAGLRYGGRQFVWPKNLAAAAARPDRQPSGVSACPRPRTQTVGRFAPVGKHLDQLLHRRAVSVTAVDRICAAGHVRDHVGVVDVLQLLPVARIEEVIAVRHELEEVCRPAGFGGGSHEGSCSCR
jgi:hypothetical protein